MHALAHFRERHETSGKDATASRAQGLDPSGQHRGDRLSPSGRARLGGDDPWRERAREAQVARVSWVLK